MKTRNNLAYICSPYKGKDRDRNIAYAKYLTHEALEKGYAPITTHLYLTQILDDDIPEQRQQGLKVGKEILSVCNTIIIGAQYGVSEGMKAEIETSMGKEIIILK